MSILLKIGALVFLIGLLVGLHTLFKQTSGEERRKVRPEPRGIGSFERLYGLARTDALEPINEERQGKRV